MNNSKCAMRWRFFWAAAVSLQLSQICFLTDKATGMQPVKGSIMPATVKTTTKIQVEKMLNTLENNLTIKNNIYQYFWSET